MSDAPVPSRFLTVMGWIVLIIGATVPVRLALEYFQLAPFLYYMGMNPRYRVSTAVGFGIALVLGGLAVWAGLGILRRRAWGPSAVCTAGGAILADSLQYLYFLAVPTIKLILETMNTKYFRIGVNMAGPTLLAAATAGAWLITLGGVLRRRGLEEFLPSRDGHPRSSLWASLMLSALLCGALRAMEAVFFWVRAVDS